MTIQATRYDLIRDSLSGWNGFRSRTVGNFRDNRLALAGRLVEVRR